MAPVLCARPRRNPILRGTGTVLAPMPRKARRTLPCATSSPSTKLAVLDATAKQIPCAPEMIAVLIPITSPCDETSGPPELPGGSNARLFSASSTATMYTPWLSLTMTVPSWGSAYLAIFRALQSCRGTNYVENLDHVTSIASNTVAPSHATTARSLFVQEMYCIWSKASHELVRLYDRGQPPTVSRFY